MGSSSPRSRYTRELDFYFLWKRVTDLFVFFVWKSDIITYHHFFKRKKLQIVQIVTHSCKKVTNRYFFVWKMYESLCFRFVKVKNHSFFIWFITFSYEKVIENYPNVWTFLLHWSTSLSVQKIHFYADFQNCNSERNM